MPNRPDIVFLMPDQLRADLLSCYGAGFIHTPNIDRLADQGVIYERAYSPHPVCVQARQGLSATSHLELAKEEDLQRVHRSPPFTIPWPSLGPGIEEEQSPCLCTSVDGLLAAILSVATSIHR
jgi:hypothetical protein